MRLINVSSYLCLGCLGVPLISEITERIGDFADAFIIA